MPTVIRGSDNIDTNNVATQTELDAKSPQMATAWVNFDGATVDGSNHCTIRDSYNVDYVLRVATGQYKVYFSTAMDNASYVIAGLSYESGVFIVNSQNGVYTKTVSEFQLGNRGTTGTYTNVNMQVVIFGGKN